MKSIGISLLAGTLTFVGCGKDHRASGAASTNQPATGNPMTAPADYLGAVGQAQKHAAKVVDTVQVQQAIRQFQAAEERLPKDLAELVKEGYLPRIPALPQGMRYDYNPANGQIRVVPAP
ncbi:MAG: hypothetical protein IPM17_08235 [Verrucomicrobia bacterium]|nr:hypothetical protein [Verrucomicrobiota bacterium]